MWKINTWRLAGQTYECSGSVCYWSGGNRRATQTKALSGVLKTENTNLNQQKDSTMNSTTQLKIPRGKPKI
jgi:hypothetical protein